MKANVSSRYGYRPIPSEIDTAELELLREALVRWKQNLQIKKFVNTERQRLDGETVSKFLETIGQVVLLSFTASVFIHTYVTLH